LRIDSPIGIFDSGLGGLTVAKRVSEKLPHESIAYVGDAIHVPYGERSPDEVRGFALGISRFLIEQNVKLIIMACNLSSATALEPAKRLFPDTPSIGVIEAGVRAALRTGSGPIGVLATRGTVSTRAYTRTVRRLVPEAEVYEQACPLFVPMVEAGTWDCAEAEAGAREYLAPLVSAGCRTLILGCTHYPFLLPVIRRVAGPDVAIIDPSEETAIEAANILFDAGAMNPPHAEPAHVYYTSARPDRFAELGSRFLDGAICGVQKITWGLELRAIEWQEKTVEETIKSAR
jgi:glutamate racemase